MKSNPRIAAALSLALLMLASVAAPAQRQEKEASRARTVAQRSQPGVSAAAPAAAGAQADDASAEIPYYSNFLSSYRLGPEDVISVTVFDLPKYSKAGIVIPPDGRMDYYLVRGGIQVTGKTTQEVADEIARHLDEYIIEPKVTVSLEKAMSMRYGVLGDVAQPGIRVMSRRMSVYEALTEAGGILATGKKQVTVLHWKADRTLQQIPIDIAAIEKGKAPDNYYLSPGDQVFVPGNKWKTVDKILKALPVISFARIFTGGF